MSKYCFPYPRDTDVPPLKVPYVAVRRYSLTGPYTFETYYINTLPNEIQGILAGVSSTAYHVQLWQVLFLVLPPSAASVQEWLFFGLASEALGRDVGHDEFLEDTTIDLRIPQWFWHELRSRWKRLRKELSRGAYKQQVDHLRRCCNSASDAIALADVIKQLDDNNTSEDDTNLALVHLSVHMLLYVIASGILTEATITCTMPYLKSTQLLLKRMINDGGWCQKRLNFIHSKSTRLFFPDLYFLSSLRPRRGTDEDHGLCNPTSCIVRTELSEPLHRTPGCACQDIQVPLDPVLKIVDGNGIPLCRIRRSPSGDFRLEIVPYSQNVKFVAISHVWADRQLGSTKNALPTCQVEHLESMLKSVPTEPSIMSSLTRDPFTILRYFIRGDDPEAVNDATGYPTNEWYFWLDTFCVPQHDEHIQLRNKAIGSMNLIYAAANQTLVVDFGLQSLDSGRSPRSKVVGGRYTFDAPADERLLDVAAHIFASNWMGRAWTLQEAVLSESLAFRVGRSLAILRMLRPSEDDQLSFSAFTEYLAREVHRFMDPDSDLDSYDDAWESKGKEPMWNRLRHHMLSLVTKSLLVDEHRQYARGLVDRSGRFVDAHARLQSRTTTMTKDLPLILMNMAGMNGNLIAQTDSSEEKMKLLFYSLGNVPVELLFCHCPRLGKSCDIDSWIPTEISPVSFAGEHFLRLNSDGFHFSSKKKDAHLKFYFVSQSASWDRDVVLHISDGPEEDEERYIVEANSACSTGKLPQNCHNGWCLLLNDDPAMTDVQGARFVITSRVRNHSRVSLNFDCHLRLLPLKKDDSQQPADLPRVIARPADSSQLFFLSRSQVNPESLSMARPQNPSQYSDRLMVVAQFVYFGSGYIERRVLEHFFGDMNEVIGNNWITVGIPYFIYNMKKQVWLEEALQASVHRAWLATYSTDWDPNGPWRWFWKVYNFEPWISFKEINKFFCRLMFCMSMSFGIWSGVAQVTLYWVVVYPVDELVGMYVISLVGLVLMRLF
ncbi:hypothetical protein V8F33_013971 [Rhypophila sp. PSN 637]